MKRKFTTKAISVFVAALMALTSMPISSFAVTGDITDLTNLLSQFETMMDGTVYTNMSEAYEAYVHGNAVIDSYQYGENNDADFYEAATRLEAAIDAMTVWSPATGTAVPSFENDSTGEGYSYTIDGHTYYNNILYTEQGYSSNSNAGSGSVKDVEMWMYYPDTVLMYTGQSSLPELPIMIKAKDNVNGAALWGYDRYVIAYYPVNGDNTDSSYFNLSGNWAAATGKENRTLDWTWTMLQTEKKPLGNSGYGNFDEDNEYSLLLTPQSGVSEYRAALANSFVFNGDYFDYSFDTSLIENSSCYMVTYYPKFAFVAGQDSNNVTYISATTPIRIFNYRFVCEAIENRKSILSQVANYKEGDLSRIMSGFDKVTTDPNSFFNSSNNYMDCLDNYENGVNEIYTQPTNYGQYYQALREIFSLTNYYGDTPKQIRDYPTTAQGDVEAYGGYNGVSWNTYASIYDAAIQELNDIVTNGYSINGMNVYNALYGTFMNMSKEGRVDVESAGDMVTMSHIIYTHAAGMNYNYYGQQISDNFNYSVTDVAESGERVTFIDVKYPYVISPNNVTAIYCITDQVRPNGYSKGSYNASAVSGSWQDEDGNTYTDAQAETESQSKDIFMRYYLTGNVSDYYAYRDGKYVEGAIEILINYVNKAEYEAASDKTTVKSYGEYEFPYVMANPSMAHEIVGIRNQQSSRKTSTVFFGRFGGSEGNASSISSMLTFNPGLSTLKKGSGGSDFPYKIGNGYYNYLNTFGTNTVLTSNNLDNSLYFDESEAGTYYDWYTDPSSGETTQLSAVANTDNNKYTSPLLTSLQFTMMDADEGINSGSYSMLEHTNEQQEFNGYKALSFSNSTNVVDVDYYIDYSDADNQHIKYATQTDGSVTPYYQFNLDVSNIYWNTQTDFRGATSYYQTFGDVADKLTINHISDPDYTGPTLDTSADIRFTSNLSGLSYRYYDTNNEYFLDWVNNYSSDAVNPGVVIPSESGNNSPYSTRLELMGISVVNNSIYREGTDRYIVDSGAKRAFPTLPKLDQNDGSSYLYSNAWTGTVEFTGTETVNKSTNTNSAEEYANYILEMGNINIIGGVGVYNTTEDTYQYYNIGVQTCDKTAIRTFLDKYVNKQLLIDPETRQVVLDENGEPTIVTDENHPNGEIKSGDYSFTTYQKYLDAIAAIYASVDNYKDTKVGDTDEGNVTAYNDDGTPIYIGTKTGENVLKTLDGITTDEEQLALIQDVIDAYNDLLDIDSFQEFIDEYNQIINDLEADGITVQPSTTGETDVAGNPVIDVIVPDGKYTQESIDDLSSALTIANVFYDYYEDPDDPQPDTPYWRDTPLKYEDYKTLNQIVQAAVGALKEAIDNEDLITTVEQKDNDLAGGIYGATEYTAKSWFNLYDKVEESKDVIADCYDEYNNLKAKYKDDDSTTVTYSFMNVEYTYVMQGTELSDEQVAVNDDYSVICETSLAPTDKASTYATFDIVSNVVSEMDRGKYTDEGLALIDALSLQLNEGIDPDQPCVYMSIDPDMQAVYKSVTGQDIELTKLKATTYDDVTGSETDVLSAQLLDMINTLNESYYNVFTAYLTVQDQDGNIIDGVDEVAVDTGKYSDTLTVDASQYCADAKSIKWSLTTFDQNNNPIGKSKKLSAYYGTKLELKADANVYVTAILTNELPQDSWTVYVYNFYHNVYDVKYVLKTDQPELDTMTGDEIASLTGVTAPVLPFYDFVEFTTEVADESTIKLIPTYTGEQTARVTLGTDGIKFGHIDEPISSTDTSVVSKFGTGVTITYSGDDFYAYAAKQANSSSYRIVSYASTYQFAAFENETYYVVTYKENGNVEAGFKIKDGADLTPENVEGVHKPAGVVRTMQECLNFMIGYKEPFVYTQTYKAYNDGTNDLLRGYFRITAGAPKAQAVGVNYLVKTSEGITEYTKNIDQIATSGQFTVTFRKDGVTYKKIPMRANATYPYTYTFYPYEGDSTQQQINTTSYSAWTYDPYTNA